MESIKGSKCGGTTHYACDCVIKRMSDLEAENERLNGQALLAEMTISTQQKKIAELEGELAKRVPWELFKNTMSGAGICEDEECNWEHCTLENCPLEKGIRC